MNITTAGVCANCGWSQFAQVTTVSTRITSEIEIMLSVGMSEKANDLLNKFGSAQLDVEGFCNTYGNERPKYRHDWKALEDDWKERER